MQGTAQEVLDSIGFDEATTGELPTVYIRARDTVRLENIAESFLQRVPLLPDADVFAQEGEAVVRWKVVEGVARGLPPIELWVELLPPPEVPVLTVTAQDYLPNAWSCVAPTFTLSGIKDGSTECEHAHDTDEMKFLHTIRIAKTKGRHIFDRMCLFSV